jgi:hypothetical protein
MNILTSMNLEIVQRSSGWWVVNGVCGPEGPFDTATKAQNHIYDRLTVKSHKMIVAAINAQGEPDFYFCKVRCNAEQYDNGDHYVLAENKSIAEGYEPKLSYDENDSAAKAILGHFVWKSATEYTV